MMTSDERKALEGCALAKRTVERDQIVMAGPERLAVEALRFVVESDWVPCKYQEVELRVVDGYFKLTANRHRSEEHEYLELPRYTPTFTI